MAPPVSLRSEKHPPCVTEMCAQAGVAVIPAEQRADDAVEAREIVIAGPISALRDIVEEWGNQSFPASDPPANW